MERKDLLKFAKIAAITYQDPTSSRDKFKAQGYNIVEFFDIKGAQGYLLKHSESKDEYVLSFRGTESAGDVLADLKARMKSEAEGVKVHRGFKGELDKLWPSIEKALAGVDRLYVTGHSLGAAMATIAAGRMQHKVLALVTFGSPRVGTREFVNGLKVPHERVQNNCDDVTKVPLLLMGYRHHGTHRYMNFSGEFKNFTTWQRIKDMVRSRIKARLKGNKFSGVFDHMMDRYIAKLEKDHV
jgi:triacylglycerol lipase